MDFECESDKLYNLDEVIDILINKENDAMFMHKNSVIQVFVGECLSGYIGVVVNNRIMMTTFSVLDCCEEFINDKQKLYYKLKYKNEDIKNIDVSNLYDVSHKFTFNEALEYQNNNDNNGKYYFHTLLKPFNYAMLSIGLNSVMIRISLIGII
jgi:hypothetical protein